MKTKVTLSFGQRRLWTLDRLEGPSATYNMPAALRLHGRVNIAAIQKTLVALFLRHEALRTVMSQADSGEPEGYLLAVPDLNDVLTVSDLSALHADDPSACAARVGELIRQEAARPFDLGQDLSLRTGLLVLSADESVLMLTLHHQAGDGVSRNILARELNEGYSAFSRDEQPDWSPLEIQYSDWAAWQQASLAEDLDAKLARAKERLHHAPALLTLPLDHPRDADRARRAEQVPVNISVRLVDRLEQLARDAHTTLFCVVLAAYSATLARLARQDEVVIGSPVAGREDIETEALIGFLLNTLALPISVSGACSGRDLIARTRATVEAALFDQDLPFERLVEELGVERSLAHTPVFQAMLSFQTQGESSFCLGDLLCTSESVGLPTAKLDLTLYLGKTPDGGLGGSFEFDADLFDAASVNRWVLAFEQCLTGLAADPSQPVLTLPLVDETARTALLALSHGKDVALSGELSLPARFAAQRAASAQDVALFFETNDQPGSLTFAELDAASNRLARHLIARSIGPDQIVAILLERSPEMVVAMLAVLKAGAAYLPLDPEYPCARLAFMLTDSQSTCVLTTQSLFTALQADTGAVLPAALYLTCSECGEETDETKDNLSICQE